MNDKQYTLIIKIIDNTIILKLNDSNKMIDELRWGDANHNTSKELLKNIDKLLKKNKLSMEKLREVKTEIDKKQKFTLVRINQIVSETINFLLNIKKSSSRQLK